MSKKYEQYEVIALLRASKELLMHVDGNIPYVFHITDRDVAPARLARCISNLIEAYDISDELYINMDFEKEDALKGKIIQAYYDIVKRDRIIGKDEIGAMVRVARELIIKLKVQSQYTFNIGKTHKFSRTLDKSYNAINKCYWDFSEKGDYERECELKKLMIDSINDMLNKENEEGD